MKSVSDNGYIVFDGKITQPLNFMVDQDVNEGNGSLFVMLCCE
jgi:hypothetical protein